jgi:hypothetical protein
MESHDNKNLGETLRQTRSFSVFCFYFAQTSGYINDSSVTIRNYYAMCFGTLPGAVPVRVTQGALSGAQLCSEGLDDSAGEVCR